MGERAGGPAPSCHSLYHQVGDIVKPALSLVPEKSIVGRVSPETPFITVPSRVESSTLRA